MREWSPWTWLVLAGLCEIVYAVAMPHTRAFTRLWPSVIALTFVAASMYGLSVAAKSIPIGTAYAVWVGIGAAGTALVGLLFLNESRDLLRIVGLLAIIGGIVALKLTHPT
jgi:quaternary ammonium compound-resistance protein SugE